jgi:hypothetical protein
MSHSLFLFGDTRYLFRLALRSARVVTATSNQCIPVSREHRRTTQSKDDNGEATRGQPKKARAAVAVAERIKAQADEAAAGL